MRVLLAGGGTAGHINPALAIADIIKSEYPDAEFLYAGTPSGMESRLVPKAGLEFTPIEITGFQRSLAPEDIRKNIKTLRYLRKSFPRAAKIIKGFQPDIVIGTGGYVSGPILFVAQQLHLPTLIHEQNAYPGVTTRFLSRNVDKVMLTAIEALEHFRTKIDYTVTGLPVRQGFTRMLTRSEAKKQLGFNENEMCILSYGGSLGAGAINDVATELIEMEQKENLAINHIHSYGKMGKDTFIPGLEERGVDTENKRLIISSYIDNMDVCTAAADLIICRSGASAISELEAMGRASILIPSPVVAGNHQYYNAMVLGSVGAATVIEQKDLDYEKIKEQVRDYYNNPGKLLDIEVKAGELYIEDTPQKILDCVKEVIDKKQGQSIMSARDEGNLKVDE